MSLEIRSVRHEELPEFHRLLAYVFASTPSSNPEGPMLPEWTTCGFVDGRLAGTFAAYPFTMRLNGAPAAVAGVTTVGTYPEFRRQGVLRSIMQHAFAEQRDRGQALAILWASFGAIYQRFGYGLASTTAHYRFDPREVAMQTPVEPRGVVRLVDAEEALSDLKRVYVEYATPRNLMLHRAAPMWQARLRPDTGKNFFVAIYHDREDQPRGYMTYSLIEQWALAEPSPNQRMEVRDFFAADLDAYHGLWKHMRSHDLVREVEMFGVAEDDPAPQLLAEPRALRRRTSDAIWMRVVDVERALPQRPYSDRGSLTLRVHDELCDWNDATYRLEVDGEGIADAQRVDEREPDLDLPVRSFAMLVSGQSSATHLARAGLLEARDPRSLALADRMFATAYRPFCPDGF